VRRAVAEAEAALAGRGRLLIRRSGTEPLVRVMAEAEDDALMERVVDELVDVIERAIGHEEAA
jgi:phosphoglucosamine mutase